MRTLILAMLLLAAQANAGERAIWTWEAQSYAMLEQQSKAQEGIAFLHAASIDTVYLYADAFKGRNLIRDQPAKYRALIRRLHRAGVGVYALLGSGYLKTERYVLPAYRGRAVAMVQRVLAYNAAATPDQRFDGINLDIEPHILDAWDRDKVALLAGFLDMSEAIVRARQRAGSTIPIGPAIPFWFDGIELDWHGRRRPVSEHTQDLYGYVALMDYRDHAGGADGIVSHAADELKYAESIGRKVVIGIETAPNEIQKVSFDHLTPADMERELGVARAAMLPSSAYGGFAIHHFAAYRRWLAR